MRQTHTHIIISILLLWTLRSCSPHWDTWHWCFRSTRKAFLSTILLVINVVPWNESNLDTHNNLHFFLLWALQSCSPYWDTWYWCFGVARKAFLFTVFLIINVHPRNKSNLDAHNNLHCFCYGHYNHVPLLGYKILRLWICKKSLSFHHFTYN